MHEIEKVHNMTKTVYALRFPETAALYQELLRDHHVEMNDRHEEAWTKKQDDYHVTFFEGHQRWLKETKLDLPFADLPYRYPTAGSSEAIREVLANLGSLAHYKPVNGPATIHILGGEYEGYKALAKPYGIRVVHHNWAERDTYGNDLERSLRSILHYAERNSTKGHYLFLSQPHSLNGNILRDFDSFMNEIAQKTDLRVALDLCYVGLVPSSKWFVKDQPKFGLNLKEGADIIDYVFFSLSKVFGVYYHRIGGVYSRNEIPGLWGNMWFKNLDSLYLGEKLMSKFGPFDLPDKYQPLQEKIGTFQMLDKTGKPFSFYPDGDYHNGPYYCEMKPSDVLLLSYGHCRALTEKIVKNDSDFELFSRGYTRYRMCLTPALYEAMVSGDS